MPRLAPGFTGCGFRDRCSHATPECAAVIPTQSPGQGHDYLCRLVPGWTKEAV